MKPSEAAKEIVALLEEAQRRGAAPASEELRQFLDELAVTPGLRKPSKTKKSTPVGQSGRTPSRVGVRPKRPTEEEMAKSIEELARKLRDAFESEAQFETVLKDPTTQALSKANVVTLYKKVFDVARPLSKSLTKPDVFNAIRRERINWVRGKR